MSLYTTIRSFQTDPKEIYAIDSIEAAEAAVALAEKKHYTSLKEIFKDEDFEGILW